MIKDVTEVINYLNEYSGRLWQDGQHERSLAVGLAAARLAPDEIPEDEQTPLPAGWYEVKAQINLTAHLPGEWWCEKQVYQLLDDNGLRMSVWEGDWSHHLEGYVADVEMDAGVYGFDAVSKATDTRLFFRVVLVDRDSAEEVGQISEGVL